MADPDDGPSPDETISQLLKQRGIKKNKDVDQLYLADKSLTHVTDLSRFAYLRILWLNGNRLRRLNCLHQNYMIEELHLHNNELIEITGALRHLTCLKVLMLQNNQLTKLERVVREFSRMQSLHTLNLFNNPVAQEKDYRLFVIQSVPSVTLLDRQEVAKSERELSNRIYDQDKEKIRDTVAFGRRSEGPPSIYYPAESNQRNQPSTDSKLIGNSFMRDNPPFETEEDAIAARRMKKSLIVYTTFDWAKVPRIEERRQSDKPFDSPELITHVYR
ncbi:leucine-rich repeat-containing protein 72-like [Ylistrum balloti]|uniref:leucine-rich repeat-containing protein 72-like n=1 Tax=Ylistrum balloti TaxID=509963 RepID=UPI002905A66D|nr:leucine-rich repeat-containing protein 72-like [Ylistrum balloti]